MYVYLVLFSSIFIWFPSRFHKPTAQSKIWKTSLSGSFVIIMTSLCGIYYVDLWLCEHNQHHHYHNHNHHHHHHHHHHPEQSKHSNCPGESAATRQYYVTSSYGFMLVGESLVELWITIFTWFMLVCSFAKHNFDHLRRTEYSMITFPLTTTNRHSASCRHIFKFNAFRQ